MSDIKKLKKFIVEEVSKLHKVELLKEEKYRIEKKLRLLSEDNDMGEFNTSSSSEEEKHKKKSFKDLTPEEKAKFEDEWYWQHTNLE